MFRTPISGSAVTLFSVFVWALATGHPVVAATLVVGWFFVRSEKRSIRRDVAG